MWCQVQATPAVPGQGCPLVRTKHAMCFTADGHIYLYGGRSMANKPLRDLWRFDTAQDQWEEVVPRIETPLNRHSTHATNSSSSSSSSSTSSSAESSPLAPENKYEPPPALQEHTIVAAKNKLYLFGGQVGFSSDETPLWIFDLVSARWSKFGGIKSPRSSNATAQPLGRRGHTAVLNRNVMSIYGGYQDFKGSSSELWTFHLEQQEWTRESDRFQKCPSPPARHNHSAVVYKDCMYVYGGMTDLQIRSDFWSWNYKTKKWNRIKTLKNPGELCCHSAIVVAESMFVYGGERDEGQAIAELWRYRFDSATWQQVTIQGIVPGCRTRHVAVAIPVLNVFDTMAQGFDWTEVAETKETSFISNPHCTLTSPNQKDEQTQVQFDCYELQPKKSISLCFEHESRQNRDLMSPAETEPKKKIIKSNSFRIRSRSPISMASLCRHSDTLSDEEELTEEIAATLAIEESENNPNVLNKCGHMAASTQETAVRMRPRVRRPVLQRQRPYSDFYGAPPAKLAEEFELNELTEKQLKRRSVQESMSYYSLCFPTPPARVAKPRDLEPLEPSDSKLESSETLTNQQSEVRMRDNSSLKRRMRKANLELRELNSFAFTHSSASSSEPPTTTAFTNPAYYSLSLDISPDFEKELPPPPSAMFTPSHEEDSSTNNYSYESEEMHPHPHNARCIDLDLIEDYLEPEEMLEIVTTESMDDPEEISPTLKLKTITKTPAHKRQNRVHSQYHSEPRTHRVPSVSHSSSGYQSLILADGIAATASFDFMSNPSLSNSSSFADQQEPSSTLTNSNFDNLNLARSITLNLRRPNPRVDLIELRPFRSPLEARETKPPPMRSRSLDRTHSSEGKHRAAKPHWQPNITEVIREVIVPRSPALFLKSPNCADSYDCNQSHLNTSPKKKPLVSALVGRGRGHKSHNGIHQNWQLCMYVFGGRDGATSGSALLNKQPISVWKLYT